MQEVRTVGNHLIAFVAHSTPYRSDRGVFIDLALHSLFVVAEGTVERRGHLLFHALYGLSPRLPLSHL